MGRDIEFRDWDGIGMLKFSSGSGYFPGISHHENLRDHPNNTITQEQERNGTGTPGTGTAGTGTGTGTGTQKSRVPVPLNGTQTVLCNYGEKINDLQKQKKMVQFLKTVPKNNTFKFSDQLLKKA